VRNRLCCSGAEAPSWQRWAWPRSYSKDRFFSVDSAESGQPQGPNPVPLLWPLSPLSPTARGTHHSPLLPPVAHRPVDFTASLQLRSGLHAWAVDYLNRLFFLERPFPPRFPPNLHPPHTRSGAILLTHAHAGLTPPPFFALRLSPSFTAVHPPPSCILHSPHPSQPHVQ
jgi:hypothetical protein